METLIPILLWAIVSVCVGIRAKKNAQKMKGKSGTVWKSASNATTKAASKSGSEQRKEPPRTLPSEDISSEMLPEGESLYDENVQGSLAFSSGEGEDLCDPELEHSRKTVPLKEDVEAAPVYCPIQLDSVSVRNGLIMGEILNNPAWKRMPMRQK